MVNKKLLGAAVLAALLIGLVGVSNAQFSAKDPGVRGGAPGAGQMLQGLNAQQRARLTTAQGNFNKEKNITTNLDPASTSTAATAATSTPLRADRARP